MYVLTVAERASRRGPDRVAGALTRVTESVSPALPFERTAGDQFQGLLAEADDVVRAVLELTRLGGWTIGVGAGPVQTPLPDNAPPATGPAFVCARRAVDAAKRRPARLAVRGAVPVDAGDAQAVLTALAVVVQRRSPAAWDAIRLVESGRTQAQTAAELGISRQAVGQRLAAASWELECELRPTAARLLARAVGAGGGAP